MDDFMTKIIKHLEVEKKVTLTSLEILLLTVMTMRTINELFDLFLELREVN